MASTEQMNAFARVDYGVVREVLSLPDGIDINSVFHSTVVDTFVALSPGSPVVEGYTYDGKVFSPPKGPSVAELIAHANEYQEGVLANNVWRFDVGTAAAPLVLTTRLDGPGQSSMSQLLIWTLAMTAAGQGNATEPYSNVDNSSATITVAQAQTLALKAGAVKSAAYATLNAVVAQIQANPPTVTTFAQVDAAAWPTA